MTITRAVCVDLPHALRPSWPGDSADLTLWPCLASPSFSRSPPHPRPPHRQAEGGVDGLRCWPEELEDIEARDAEPWGSKQGASADLAPIAP
jgi:hypothetical protein